MTNKIEMPDFSKSFKFEHIDSTFYWDAVLQKVVTEDHRVLENLPRSTVENYIGEGIWKLIQEPKTFRIVESSYLQNKATLMQAGECYQCTWDNGQTNSFDKREVDQCLQNRIWKIIDTPKPAQVDESNVKQSPEPTLLDRIKSFATLTGTSIFIQPDGEYEVYYDDPFMPATAKNDEEMKKLMDAIAVLHVATYGEA